MKNERKESVRIMQDELISKQAVIDMTGLSEWFDSSDSYNEFVIALSELPPATPQQKNEDIVKAFQLGLALGFGEKHDEMDKVIDEIKKVVTPQPKTGHWIYTGDYITEGMLKCSECGFEHDVSERFSFCPECGAKMVEPQESDEEIKLGIDIGDEVIGDYGAKGVVVGIVTYKGEVLLSLLMRNLKVPQLVKASRYKTKTGRHFPQIVEVLDAILP